MGQSNEASVFFFIVRNRAYKIVKFPGIQVLKCKSYNKLILMVSVLISRVLWDWTMRMWWILHTYSPQIIRPCAFWKSDIWFWNEEPKYNSIHKNVMGYLLWALGNFFFGLIKISRSRKWLLPLTRYAWMCLLELLSSEDADTTSKWQTHRAGGLFFYWGTGLATHHPTRW